MSLSPEDKPYSNGTAGQDGHTWKYRVWTTEEWDRISPERRPPGVTRLGEGWAEIMYGDRTDQGVPVDNFRGPTASEVRSG